MSFSSLRNSDETAKYASRRRLFTYLTISCFILLVHGFHYGVEDEAIYLPAVKKFLNPSLYPHDARFFSAQTNLTVFPAVMALLSRISHLPVHWTFLIVYCATVFLFVVVLRLLAEKIFPEEPSRWAAILLPSALWTMPVAGTALFIMDQHMHPRNLATVALVFALVAILEGKSALAGVLVLGAAAVHPLMSLYGAGLLILFARKGLALQLAGLAAAFLLAWRFLPAIPQASLQAANSYYYLSQWAWYEWLGIVGPLVILIVCAGWAHTRIPLLSVVARKLVQFEFVYLLVALLVSFVPRFALLAALQPMRILQPIYLLMFFFAGGILIQLFRRQIPALVILFLALSVGMFYAQLNEFPGTPHSEWPLWRSSSNWLEAFDWIRQNTPIQAYFVMDPRYLERPGEDFHGFRAFAERSVMADQIEDRTVASLFPDLAEEWWAQSEAQQNWSGFNYDMLRRLKARFGADWVLIEKNTQPVFAGLACPYENAKIRVCRID